ncbi:ornithine decarboxylase, partial [Serratia marcescens]|nr:ornithine decarboxylase [Serratia marcescens]
VCCEEELDNAVLPALHGVFELCGKNTQFYGTQLEAAAAKYESELLPPFFNTLPQYVEMGTATFACPGHQGGEFFRKHPAGRQFVDF